MPLFDCVEVDGETAKGKPKKINVCPHCYKKGHEEIIRSQSQKFGAVPVLVSYFCESGCRPTRGERRHNDPNQKKREYFEKYDLGKIREIKTKEIPHWYPKDRMMHAPEDQECWGLIYRPGSANPRTVADLFAKRSLWALSVLLHGIVENSQESYLEPLTFVFHSNVFQATIMQQYREAGGGFAKGTYYTPPIWIERNQRDCLRRKLSDVVSGLKEVTDSVTSTALIVSTDDARYLQLPNN